MKLEGLEIVEEDGHSLSHHHQLSDHGGTPVKPATTPRNAAMEREAAVARRVSLSRLLVVLVILVSTAAVSVSAFQLLKRDERDDFESKSLLVSKEIGHLSRTNALNIFNAISNLAQTYPALCAAERNETLPFCTFDNYEALAFGARRLAKSESIIYMPLLKTQEQLDEWGNYSFARTGWMDRGRSFNFGSETKYSSSNDTEISSEIKPYVFSFQRGGPPGPPQRVPVTIEDGSNKYASPIWQIHPVPTDGDIINYDLGQDPIVANLLNFTTSTFQPVLSGQNAFGGNRDVREDQSPDSMLLFPIFNGFPQDATYELVGHIVALIPWTTFLSDVLQEEQEATVVIESCDKNTTFLLSGSEARWVGSGDQHDARFEYLVQKRELITFYEYDKALDFVDVCRHQLYIFPTAASFARVQTSKPKFYTMVIVGIFVLMGLVIFLYDFLVTVRQTKTEQKAEKSNAIVQELFPGNTAQQLFFDDAETPTAENDWYTSASPSNNKNHNDNASASLTTMTKPNTIAELYPNATILFADIAGFTSWSSLREPAQVFLLLESIFQSFDAVAKRMGVFKVETIGDCYVAVCGVPQANTKHAVVMAEFAREMLQKFDHVVRGDLELTLGPDTAELGLRVGLHTGPVTAGVIRGERARFQLFGDSVNTTARIESTGKPDQIHLSEQAYKELKRQSKAHWCLRRAEKVLAKGKGELETYWLLLDSGRVCDNAMLTDDEAVKGPTPSSSAAAAGLSAASSAASSAADSKEVTVDDHQNHHHNDKPPQRRLPVSTNASLVDWNAEVLVQLLSNVVACRPMLKFDSCDGKSTLNGKLSATALTELGRSLGARGKYHDEIADVISMPRWTGGTTTAAQVKAAAARLDATSVGHVRAFVERICALYNNVPFHNFEHASHVAMSTNKMLSSHCHNYGVETDPLTQLACFVAALVHDVGHVGVPNGVLAVDNPSLAALYGDKSIAEQHSVSIAWETLFLDEFAPLRALLFTSESELRHFRRLLVNSLMGTDIFDETLRAGRQARWSRAFNESDPGAAGASSPDRRATVVLEHLIQASDVSHTMQHWHVYRKWNERLYCEMHDAYRSGRLDKDPAPGWYDSELAFFDKYVIPLAHKMRDCNFGAASGECLNYATANRNEWSAKGRDLVAAMQTKVAERYNDERTSSLFEL